MTTIEEKTQQDNQSPLHKWKNSMCLSTYRRLFQNRADDTQAKVGRKQLLKIKQLYQRIFQIHQQECTKFFKNGFLPCTKSSSGLFSNRNNQQKITIRNNDMNEEDQDIFWFSGKLTGKDPHESFSCVPKRENYDWSKQHIMVSKFSNYIMQAHLNLILLLSQNRDIQISGKII